MYSIILKLLHDRRWTERQKTGMMNLIGALIQFLAVNAPK